MFGDSDGIGGLAKSNDGVILPLRRLAGQHRSARNLSIRSQVKLGSEMLFRGELVEGKPQLSTDVKRERTTHTAYCQHINTGNFLQGSDHFERRWVLVSKGFELGFVQFVVRIGRGDTVLMAVSF